MGIQKTIIRSASVLALLLASTGPLIGAEEQTSASSNLTTETSQSLVESSTTTSTATDTATSETSTSAEDSGEEVIVSEDGTIEDSTQEAADNSAILYQEINSRVTGAVFGTAVAMPVDLVETWTATNTSTGYTYNITIQADGTGTNVINYGSDAGTTTINFAIGQVEQVADGLYRYVDGTNTDKINEGGIGGYGIQYDFGFSLVDGAFQPVFWSTTQGQVIDYSQPNYGAAFNKEAEQVTVTTSQATSSSSKALTSATSQQQSTTASNTTESTTLPTTGEKGSVLPLIGGVLLVILAGLTLLNQKKIKK